ncbi:MAG: hypothetical protein ABI120_02565 [Gemmatimonadaceae bacterium]
MLIDLYNKDTNELLGSITEAELQHVLNTVELESPRDDDFYMQKGTIELLGNDGLATVHLMKLLREAVGDSDGLEIRWHVRNAE